ncbi:Hsp20/alpha crystallin family protein [bacterium RCC_150]
MSDIMRHMPFEVPESVRRFLQGDAGSWLRVEEFNDGSAMVIRAEIPGIDPDRDVDITVSGRTLTIEARREEKTEQRDKENYRSEFRYGAFSRSFSLPSGVNEDDIKADYNDGILEVRVPSSGQDTEARRKVRVNRPGTSGTAGSAGTSDTSGTAGTMGTPGTTGTGGWATNASGAREATGTTGMTGGTSTGTGTGTEDSGYSTGDI